MAFSMMLYGAEGILKGDYWMTTLGTDGPDEIGYSAAIDSSNNVYVCGTTNSSAGAGSIDVLLSKYDSAGTLQWQKTLGGDSTERGFEVAIDPSDDDNVYVTGYTYSESEALFLDIILVKYDSAGNLQWQRVISGGGNDYSQSVAIDSNHNVYLGGYLYLEDTWNFLLLRYNSNGTFEGERIFHGDYSSFGMSLAIDSSDNTYMFGITESPGDDVSYDFLILKYNSTGTLQWQRTLSGAGKDMGRSVAIDSSDNVYMFGYTTSTVDGSNDFLLAKYNSSGTIQWQQTLGGTGDDFGWSVDTDSSDNVYVFGHTKNVLQDAYDFLLAKYNSSGVIQWQRTLVGAGLDYGRAVAIDSNDDVIVFGYTEVEVDSGSFDVLLAKLPNDGRLTGTYSIGDLSFTYAKSFLETKTSTLTSAESALGRIYTTLDSRASSLTSTNSEFTSSFVKL
jgi:uncharacterized delta-60 repeat protein